jgi:transposase-like protein
MSEFTETTTYTVNCPECAADRVRKMGVRNNQQRYRCLVCDKAFRANGKGKGRWMDAELMGSAIRDYYTGKSYKQIAEGLKEEYDLEKEPSKATVYEWVRDYTDEAIGQMKDHKAQTGGHWVADEMQVDVGGQKMWLWNVMDSETRYILASHLTPRRDAQAARVVFRKAIEAADKPPKTITTDKLRSYVKPIKDIMPEARHMQSEGLSADINNNLSERLQGTFRGRVKTLRGLDSRKTGQRYLDGWVLTYNLFRGHESLRNKTPGERAKVDPPFREWADVVKDGAASRPVVKAEARPVSQSKPKLPPPKAAQARPPLAEVSPVQGKGQARKRHRIPKPIFPKMSRKAEPRNLPPRWAKFRPRLPGRN